MTAPIDDAGSAEDEIRRDAAWRHQRVAVAAYYLAEHRGFEPGQELADWSRAELQTEVVDRYD